MSCGKPHETKCSEVLAKVYFYLDQQEISDVDCSRIKQHLDECGPCLRQYGIEEHVKALVGRTCGCETAPDGLRLRVLERIRQVSRDGAFEQTTEIRTEISVDVDRADERG